MNATLFMVLFAALVICYVVVSINEVRHHIKQTSDDTPIDYVPDLYTGRAWHHHRTEDFIINGAPTFPNGAGAGSTIFLDFIALLDYLKKTNDDWYVCCLYLNNAEIRYDFSDKRMVTLVHEAKSPEGYYRLCDAIKLTDYDQLLKQRDMALLNLKILTGKKEEKLNIS